MTKPNDGTQNWLHLGPDRSRRIHAARYTAQSRLIQNGAAWFIFSAFTEDNFTVSNLEFLTEFNSSHFAAT
ncbi:hypothetical protein RRG08_020380 [Elysia crispata]|uniref:Uncharacterized protein n=1 Tax=Elysia crispata TaxID=231223 RepID=A0AAE0Z6C0_9GAST|nr:hypothetical protein RRG08_020380 [Elysia crispata]